jgi:hypothetical protein
MRASLTFTVLCCVFFASPATALAQTRDAAGAEKLYDDGSKLLEAGDWAGACAKFEQSHALDAAPGTLLNLASCAEHDGKVALAWSRLKDARSLNADTKSDKQRGEIEAFIDASLRRLEPRLPFLTVRVANKPEGLSISRDGTPSAEGVELPVDPGHHVVEVSAPGFGVARREVDVTEGAKLVIEIELSPKATGAPPPPQPEPPSLVAPEAPQLSEEGLTPLQIAGIAIGSVGVATLLVSIGTGAAALGKESELEELGCSPTPRETLGCSPSQAPLAADLASEGSTLALASTVTTFVGAGLAGGGLLMALLGGRPSGSSSTGVVPLVGPGHAAITFGGRF